MRCKTALAVPVRWLSWSTSSYFIAIQTWCVPRSRKSQKNTPKHRTLEVQDYSRSSTLMLLKSSSPVLVIISSMPIFNCFHPRWANSSKITTFQGYPSLMLACTGLLEPRVSWLWQLNAENFMCRLSWSISSHFGAIYSWNVCCSQK